MAIADKIVVMSEGRIEDAGAPERIYNRPATRFAAGFMGEVNFIEGTGDGRAVLTPLGALPLDGVTGAVTLAIRPEHARAGGDLALGRARVTDSAFFGTHVRAHVAPEAAPDRSLVVHLPQNAAARPGDTIDLSVAREDVVALAA